jgi:hypothetical protein
MLKDVLRMLACTKLRTPSRVFRKPPWWMPRRAITDRTRPRPSVAASSTGRKQRDLRAQRLHRRTLHHRRGEERSRQHVGLNPDRPGLLDPLLGMPMYLPRSASAARLMPRARSVRGSAPTGRCGRRRPRQMRFCRSIGAAFAAANQVASDFPALVAASSP